MKNKTLEITPNILSKTLKTQDPTFKELLSFDIEINDGYVENVLIKCHCEYENFFRTYRYVKLTDYIFERLS